MEHTVTGLMGLVMAYGLGLVLFGQERFNRVVLGTVFALLAYSTAFGMGGVTVFAILHLGLGLPFEVTLIPMGLATVAGGSFILWYYSEER